MLIPVIGDYSMFAGVVGVGLYLAFLVYSFQGSKAVEHHHTVADEDETKQNDDHADNHSDGDNSDDEEEQPPVAKGVLYLVVGGTLIFLFADNFIDSVVVIASSLQVSPTLLAFFLAPVASEAPEILESIQLSRKGVSQHINIAFSNLIGGTITKTTLLFGIFNFYGVSRSFVYESPQYSVSLLLLSLCAGVAGATGAFMREIPVTRGYMMFGLFGLTGLIQYYTTTQYA